MGDRDSLRYYYKQADVLIGKYGLEQDQDIKLSSLLTSAWQYASERQDTLAISAFQRAKNIILYNLESKRDTISYILDMDGEIVIYRLIDDPQAMYRACVAQRSIMTGYGNNHKDWKDYANYLAWNYFRSADALYGLGKPDSAFLLVQKAFSTDSFSLSQFSYTYELLGKISLTKNDSLNALALARKAMILTSNRPLDYYLIARENLFLAECEYRLKLYDSALQHAYQARTVASRYLYPDQLLECYRLLAQLCKQQKLPDNAFDWLEKYINLRDSINKQNSIQAIQRVEFENRIAATNAEAAAVAQTHRLQITGLAIFILFVLLIAYNSMRHARVRLKDKEQIESAYKLLQSSQAQLIQQEKMASLGELTAGIAHEIQNPLNFVNNFSDVNTELIGELKEELAAGNLQMATEIADDIQQNEAKINHHGKRADGIVKGMLQHSRSNTGEKEATNINKLADEYLRLSYQGMRAKDNTFNTEIATSFDETIGNINVVSQDIGRVLLNLYNNAFYAVNERQKAEGVGFKAAVSVTTKKNNNKIEISVADNGSGIPEKIKEKIFQPFFTTKPTGSGTGLGLSLSYDIVKAHGGEIKLISTEGNETTFLIQLPI